MRASARERRLVFQDRTPLGREILNKTNAEAIIREARNSLDRLDANIQLAQKLRFEDRQRAMEDVRSHLADIRAQLTPGVGTTAADLLPHEVNLNQALGRRETLEKQVNEHIVRIQELTRNGVHRFLTENPVINGVGGVLSTTFGGIFSTLRDVGTIIGPTVESMWRPVESAGSTVLNFLAGAVGRLNPQIGEQLRARAQLVLQQEQLLKAFSSAANRITGRQIAPVTEQEDRNAQTELQQIQQRSGRDVQSFASLTLQQLSRLPSGTPGVPPPGGTMNMRLLVQLAELAFPVGSVAPLVTPAAPVSIADTLNAASTDINITAGGLLTLNIPTGGALDCPVRFGATALGTTAGATMSVVVTGGSIVVTRVNATTVTVQTPSTATIAVNQAFTVGGGTMGPPPGSPRPEKNFTLHILPR